MKNMRNIPRILIDTNVLLDFISYREPHAEQANQLLLLCENRLAYGCIAAHTIPDIFYILRKDFTSEELREIMLNLCQSLRIVGVDAYKIIAALENREFLDFEDCLQMQCAIDYHANYIITRNCGDFAASTIPVMEPGAFLALAEQGE